MLSRRVLSKEEESQTTDAEVTREDQDEINRFSSLHNRVKILDAEVEARKNEQSDLNDLSTELELVLDEDEPVQYKIGDSFFAIPLSEAQELIEADKTEKEEEVSKLEDQVTVIREEMEGLKGHLYARFGRGINLEA